nr:capsid protein [Avian nephritis virus]
MPGPAGPGNGGTRPKTQLAKPKKAKKSPSQKKPSQQKPLKREVRKVEKQISVLKKRTNGPKANDFMKTTVTVGTILGQTDNGLVRQFRITLNPLLLKTTEGQSTTPLSIRASCYEMWKPVLVEFYATPLSGMSNVVGSVGFMALTLNGLEATVDSIDTIKARKHVQMTLGRPAKFKLTSQQLAGPRRGWWLIDTSQSPADSYGPAVDCLLAYKTDNLLNTTGGVTAAYTGALWQIEARVCYHFATYCPKPGLANLVAQTIPPGQNVTIKASADDGSIVMTTTSALIAQLLEPRTSTDPRKGKSETVWAVAGAVVEAAAPLLGPWGWLLKGGFWLVRKIFGASNDTATYQVYPSIEAAMGDQPIYGQTSGTNPITLPVVHISEVMNPNPQSNNLSLPSASLPPQPQPPQPQPTSILPLSLLEGQRGVPPLYTYSGGSYEVSPNWLGSTLLLTGLPRYRRLIGGSQQFGPNPNGMQPFACDSLDVYDFTDNGVFFGFGTYQNQGAIHTGKTLLYSIKNSPDRKPWLGAEKYIWQWPTWVVQQGYPQPKQGDWWLQMQNTTDTRTHTVATLCYFLIAYRDEQKLVAFWNNNTGSQAAPSTIMCLYNVDAGRAPVLTSGHLPPFILSSNEVEVDGDEDDDISLADSCLRDEFDCVEPYEQERERLIKRLRELDFHRFQV